MSRSRFTSGLSQQVIYDGTPYSVEIFRDDLLEDWTVLVVDAIAKATVWRRTASDDVIALMGAIAHVHSINEPSYPSTKKAKVRLC